ncbi:alpha/beta hydrolase, partial [bacterium]|nr:alpha/beta hydrolase [bacterium]
MNSACTRSTGYRQSPGLTLEKLAPKISLGHVEIDDQGELISFDQLKRVTAKIKAESTEPLLLIVYIHGWNHNASGRWITGDGDLDDFRDMLKDLGKASGRKTMGVFVSWRGRSLATFPVGVDYFHRHAAARRVGGVAGTEVLHELGAAARGANPENRIVMVGHSLGGAVLESAMAEAISARVAMDSVRGRKLKRKDFPADLIVSINSSESSIYARQLLSTFKNRGIKDIEGGPLMVSLTSQRDFITSVFWPIGNIMGRWVPGINFFNTGVAGMYRKDPENDKLRGTQAAAHRSTVGHFKPLFSHRFDKVADQERSLEQLYHDNRDAREG